MLNLVKVISTSLDNSGRRIIKFLRFGMKDVRTATQTPPFGFDSNPTKGMIAVYGDTEQTGAQVIIGYINRNQLSEVGESRLYSTDAEGTLKFFVWLKADGTLQLGGATNHLAAFESLKSGFDELKSDHNDLVSAFNAHMHPTAASGPPSIPTPGTGIPAVTSTASIDDSKIDKITTL